MCTNEWRLAASTLCLLSFPRKKLQENLLKMKLNRPIPIEVPDYCWLFQTQQKEDEQF